MTLQMRQALQLLQMNAVDLDQLVSDELTENPFLELADEAAAEAGAPSTSTVDAVDAPGNGEEQAQPAAASEAEPGAPGPDAESASASEPAALDSVPALEEPVAADQATSDQPVEEQAETFQEVDVEWDDFFEPFQGSTKYTFQAQPDEEERDFTEYTAQGKSLYDHLTWQLRVSGLDDAERKIAYYLINNIFFVSEKLPATDKAIPTKTGL